MSVKINITGDLYIDQNYNTNTQIGPDIANLFGQADFNIVNLETPVTESTSKILKTGPNLKADKHNTLKVLEALKVGIVTLATNHILDYGEKGLTDTLAFCEQNKIKSIGAGNTLKEASKTLFFDTEEGKIALVNFAENEWASATANSAGANPMDIIDNARQIKNAKEEADFVFVITHGGASFYNLPSPEVQKRYRFYAESGADIVIGHHTHCIGGYETYEGVPIYYSLGNFLFTREIHKEDWYIGLILEVCIVEGELKSKLLPMQQGKKDFALSLLKEESKKEVLDRISRLNEVIQDPKRIGLEWDTYVNSMYDLYLKYWSPVKFVPNRYIRGLISRIGLKGFNKKGVALMLNLMRCETHLEISKSVIQKWLVQK